MRHATSTHHRVDLGCGRGFVGSRGKFWRYLLTNPRLLWYPHLCCITLCEPKHNSTTPSAHPCTALPRVPPPSPRQRQWPLGLTLGLRRTCGPGTTTVSWRWGAWKEGTRAAGRTGRRTVGRSHGRCVQRCHLQPSHVESSAGFGFMGGVPCISESTAREHDTSWERTSVLGGGACGRHLRLICLRLSAFRAFSGKLGGLGAQGCPCGVRPGRC